MPARPFGDAKPVKGAYVLLVSGKLKPGQLQTFITNFRPLAAHVAQHEDGCLAYELSVADSDPDSIIIYERYTSKSYLESVHWQSEPYKAFQAANREAGIEWVERTKKVVRYVEQDIGFADQGSRDFGDSKALKHAYVVLATGKLGPGQLQSAFLPLFRPLAAYMAQHEDNTHAYELSVAEDDPDRFVVYERYTSKSDLDAHAASEAYKNLVSALQSQPLDWEGDGLSIVGYTEQDVGF